jgi:hypothetical protein
MAQDRGLELPEERRRLQSQLVPQHAAELVIDLKGFGLSAAAVKGEHEQAAKTLAHRMLADQSPQLCRECTRRAESQIRLDPLLQARQVQFLQPGDLRLCERFIAEIGQRGTLPQGQRLAQRPGSLCHGPGRESITPFGQKPLEQPDVQLVREDPQHVAPPPW